MAYISIELFRSDFNLKAWEDWEKGYKTLLLTDLKNFFKMKDIIEQSHYVFISYNGSPYILKEKRI